MNDSQRYQLRELSSELLSLYSKVNSLSHEIRKASQQIDSLLIEDRPKKKKFKFF